MTQCSYYYHTWSNMIPKRCSKDEGHEGDHVEEKINQNPINQSNQPLVGWRKH